MICNTQKKRREEWKALLLLLRGRVQKIGKVEKWGRERGRKVRGQKKGNCSYLFSNKLSNLGYFFVSVRTFLVSVFILYYYLEDFFSFFVFGCFLFKGMKIFGSSLTYIRKTPNVFFSFLVFIYFFNK